MEFIDTGAPMWASTLKDIPGLVVCKYRDRLYARYDELKCILGIETFKEFKMTVSDAADHYIYKNPHYYIDSYLAYRLSMYKPDKSDDSSNTTLDRYRASNYLEDRSNTLRYILLSNMLDNTAADQSTVATQSAVTTQSTASDRSATSDRRIIDANRSVNTVSVPSNSDAKYNTINMLERAIDKIHIEEYFKMVSEIKKMRHEYEQQKETVDYLTKVYKYATDMTDIITESVASYKADTKASSSTAQSGNLNSQADSDHDDQDDQDSDADSDADNIATDHHHVGNIDRSRLKRLAEENKLLIGHVRKLKNLKKKMEKPTTVTVYIYSIGEKPDAYSDYTFQRWFISTRELDYFKAKLCREESISIDHYERMKYILSMLDYIREDVFYKIFYALG